MKNANQILKCICFLITGAFLFGCDPENEESCDLGPFNLESYEGIAYLCNAEPGEQIDLMASAKMEVSDTILSFTVSSNNPNVPFNYKISVVDRCGTVEVGKVHILYDINTGENIGQINQGGTRLFIYMKVAQCEDNSFFEGFIN
jgi:hypothetical protein